MADGPLAGRRIVVTRPRRQAAALAEALELHGADAVVVPLIEIQPTDVEMLQVSAYDWIVFTSANAVDAVRDRIVGELPVDVRLAAVGPATAAVARELGIEPTFVPERYASDEIAAGLEPLEGARILLPQADIASPQLAAELRDRGALVDCVVAYRTVAAELHAADVAELRWADAIVLASGSAARTLARAGGAGESALLVCIGPKTASVAGEAGLPVGLVAEEASVDGIIRALVSHYGEST